MPDQSPISTAPDSQAMLRLLQQIRRELESYTTRPYVNIGGQYRLEVNNAGQLVATHGGTSKSTVIATP